MTERSPQVAVQLSRLPGFTSWQKRLLHEELHDSLDLRVLDVDCVIRRFGKTPYLTLQQFQGLGRLLSSLDARA